MAVITVFFESLLFKTMDLVDVFVVVGSVAPLQLILLIVAEDDGDIPPLLLIVPLLPLLLVPPPDTPLVLLLLLLLLSNTLDVTTSVVVGVVVDTFEFVVLFVIVLLSNDNIGFKGLVLLLTGLSFVSKDFVNFCKKVKLALVCVTNWGLRISIKKFGRINKHIY